MTCVESMGKNCQKRPKNLFLAKGILHAVCFKWDRLSGTISKIPENLWDSSYQFPKMRGTVKSSGTHIARFREVIFQISEHDASLKNISVPNTTL